MKTKKSQTGVDFLIAIGIIVFFFTMILSVTYQLQKDKEKTSKDLDRRAECLKFSDLISYTYLNGPGTQVKTHSNYLVSVLGLERYIYVTDLNENIGVAALASERAPTLHNFYVNLTEKFLEFQEFGGLDWYKQCNRDGDPCNEYVPTATENFSASGVHAPMTDAEWASIPNTMKFEDLIANINNYNLIFLDDPKIEAWRFDAYKQILENWVSQGNILFITGDLKDTGGATETYDSFDIDFTSRLSEFWNVWEFIWPDTRDQTWQANRISIIKNDSYFKNLKKHDTFETKESSFVNAKTLFPTNYQLDVETVSVNGNNFYSNKNSPATKQQLRRTRYKDCEDGHHLRHSNNVSNDDWGLNPTCHYSFLHDCNLLDTPASGEMPIFGYGKRVGGGGADATIYMVKTLLNLTFDLSSLDIDGSGIRKITVNFGGCWGGFSAVDDPNKPDCNGGNGGAFNDTYGYPSFSTLTAVDGSTRKSKFEMQIYKVNPNPINRYEKLKCKNIPNKGKILGNSILYGPDGILPPCNEIDDTINLSTSSTDPAWGEVRTYHDFSFEKIGGFSNDHLSSSDKLVIRFNMTAPSNTNNAMHFLDYVNLEIEAGSGQLFTVVGIFNLSEEDYYSAMTWPSWPVGEQSTLYCGEATTDDKPAIAYWNYGAGKIFYISDSIISTEFSDVVVPQSDYTDSLVELVKKLYLYFIQQKEASVCTFIGKGKDKDLTGDILIKNENNEVILEGI